MVDVAAARPEMEREEGWVVTDLRRLAAAGCAGLVAGFFVNGIGSRLAMMLLARLNPDATGRISDDGFMIGRFDLGSTVGLLLFTTAVGVLGGLIFLAVRHLRFGPPWFQSASITIGAAVVVGSQLVHTSGVDFRILHPVWLAVALFVALPGIFAFVVMRLADHWLQPQSWFLRGSPTRLVTLAPLLLAAPAFPALLVGAVGRVAYRLVPAVRHEVLLGVLRITARLGLAAIFALALFDLVRDITDLL